MTSQIEISNNPQYISVLNHGFVGLIDSLGNDESIVRAARVSYGKGTKKLSENRDLIRYLVRHSHNTPLEQVVFQFHVKLPIFVARQWIRHRTWSFNEYSGRYSEMTEDMYLPELKDIKPQSANNKQGRSGCFSIEKAKDIQSLINGNNETAQRAYKELLNTGLTRELSRGVLSVNNYTEWFCQVNLHNLFHFLKLRLDKHAQYEIRVYAEVMYKLIKDIVPLACKAFEDYIFDFEDGTYQNYHLSKTELETLRNVLKSINEDNSALLDRNIETTFKGSKRELDEFKRRFKI
jgi:thymidylate synthase (FAD)